MRNFFLDREQRSRNAVRAIAACAALLLAALVGTVHAAAPAPLPTKLTLTHIAADKWRADYVFAEPITAVELGAQVGPYRKQAWRPLTPGVELVADDGSEAMRSASPLTELSVEISAYDDFDEGQYAPIDRFSDGGWDFYLGFLHGALTQDDRQRSMDVALHLQGLPGETVIAPAKPGTELTGYAYFGPQKPVRMGNVNVIIDPKAPAWLREVIDDTTTKVSQYYEQAFQRDLIDTPLISVAVVGFDGAPGTFNVKGGVAGGGITYRLQGAGLVDDHPKKRAYMARLVAHEMAHLWQVNLMRGGIGGDDAWVHEGGAEAIMLEAMRATGIFTAEASDQYAQELLKECDQLAGDVTVNRGLYACGFKRFHGYAMAPMPLWRAMMARSEGSGEFYSESMIQAILKQ
ncbi:hypothetical protein [Montanilutibacter psychrotolerans]|uniref:Uncharacterized protein n=1 Tax=Montanilutibacter psychrotolerans TaxID=1327343 RepID=A0A3M8SPG8_9GAMM|nr:hypothetical protein [Lysobacter psychrotolerans]RNF83207.1 hypothetical protein EER27_11935 [Lysobacter psychrotolerans]